MCFCDLQQPFVNTCVCLCCGFVHACTEMKTKKTSNIPVQCWALCSLWESCCCLAWERASATLWGDQPSGLQTNKQVKWQFRHSQMCGNEICTPKQLIRHNVTTTCLILCRPPFRCQNSPEPSRHGRR